MEGLRWGVCLAAILSVTVAADIEHFQVMYDHKVNMTCMNTNYDPAINEQIMWILPNGDLVKKTDQHDRVELHEDGKQIIVKKVDDEDFGVYNCIIYLYGTQNYRIVQKGVNVNGPYWGDLTAKYRINIIVGSVAAAVVLVLMLGICYIMNRDHSLDKDESDRIKASNLWMSNTGGINNAAVELDEVEGDMKKSPPVNGDSPPSIYANQGSELATKL